MRPHPPTHPPPPILLVRDDEEEVRVLLSITLVSLDFVWGGKRRKPEQAGSNFFFVGEITGLV